MRKKLYEERVGSRGCTVWIQERERGGNLYLRWWDSVRRRWKWKSQRHRDRQRARQNARSLSDSMAAGADALRTGALHPDVLFALYEDRVTSLKKGQQPAEDRRRMDVWQAFFAREELADVAQINTSLLENFVGLRGAGQILVPGRTLHRDVSARTIGADIEFLQIVLNWAMRTVLNGNPLLQKNPVKGFRKINTLHPRRLWATYDWYEAIRPFCDYPTPVDARGLFGQYLDLLESLGWRVSAVCELRASDFLRKPTAAAPDGLLRRKAEKRTPAEWIPLPEAAREAMDELLKRNPAIGDAWLFPAPKANRPWNRHYVGRVLKRLVSCVNEVRLAEAARSGTEAELVPYANPHGFRRKFEEERRDLPEKDRMDATGRSDPRALRTAYLRKDAKRILAVMQTKKKLRAEGGDLVLEG